MPEDTDYADKPIIAVYLYASGSDFEQVMNEYMITGRGINPFNPRGQGIEGIALNATEGGGVFSAVTPATATGLSSIPSSSLSLVSDAQVSSLLGGIAVQ